MKQSRKDFIKKAHENACSEWKTNIEKEFPELFKRDALEVGKWYKRNNDNKIWFLTEIKEGCSFGYGFNYSGYWADLSKGYNYSLDLMPATDKEVDQALIKEAKKKGFKEGDHVRCLNDGRIRVVTEYHMSTPDWEIDVKGGFNLGDITVMLDGVWATIIETITKEQAEKAREVLAQYNKQ